MLVKPSVSVGTLVKKRISGRDITQVENTTFNIELKSKSLNHGNYVVFQSHEDLL